MAKNDKMTHLMKKAAPFIAGLAGDVNADTVDKDLEALVLALNAHKTSADHDSTAHVWAGVQQFLKTMVTTSILPSLAETYDIGSDTRRFRKGFFSELSSLIFKKDNIIVLDGKLLISKMAGVLPAAVLSTDMAIDFGETMIPGDVLIMRSEGKMEYIEVGALESGTTYTVTRDLDGSGANDWPEGEPFAVLGSEGDGWLEISAVGERRFSVYAMGATFNAAMEIARYGEIVGWQSAGFSGVGLAFGDFANNKYFVSTDADGMVAVGLSLKIGTGEKDIDLTGIQIDDTEIVGQNNGVDQVVIGADGKLIAGDGNVRIDENGVSINAPYADELWSEPASLTIKDFDLDDFAIGRLRGYTAYGLLRNKFVLLEARSNDDVFGSILVLSADAKVDGNGAAIRLYSKNGSTNPKIQLEADEVNVAGTLGATNISATPTPNYIPKANTLGKIDAGWLPDLKNIYVDLLSAQTVAGVKTFSSIPVLPSSNPTTADQAVRKGYADATYLGITAKAADSDKLDGQLASYYALASHLHTGTYIPLNNFAVFSSTLTGWAATPNQQFTYVVIGKLLLMSFYAAGTSNATSARATLPAGITGATQGVSQYLPCRITNAGTLQAAPGMAVLASNGTYIDFYLNYAGALFTNSGTKTISGNFAWIIN